MFGKKTVKKKEMSSLAIIVAGFAGLILGGALLLMLPIASKSGEVTSFLDTLFTATSAVCVTGLVVQDTGTYWSFFGQAVIIVLIQIGGLGIITFSIAFASLRGQKIGLMQRSTMQEAISATQVGGIVQLTRFILMTVLIIEGLGALLMMPTFIRKFGVGRGIWTGVFHSISAFCNAGFDLMGDVEKFSSLTTMKGSVIVNVVIMLLIVIGGLGFLTWEDIKNKGFHFQKYRMQSKVIIVTILVLIFVPALLFFMLELSRPEFADLSFGERIMAALFQSVTLRTAGFNTVDLTKFTEPGLVIMIMVMLVGGAPGSTAGGLKVTTIAVLVAGMFASFFRKPSVHVFKRRVPQETVALASSIFMLYLGLLLIGGLSIAYLEDVSAIEAFFEAASALATVGLTLGITTKLGALSKIILIILMFMGRVGGMNFIFVAVSERRSFGAELPKEKITVG